jgi:hypothetical protein
VPFIQPRHRHESRDSWAARQAVARRAVDWVDGPVFFRLRPTGRGDWGEPTRHKCMRCLCSIPAGAWVVYSAGEHRCVDCAECATQEDKVCATGLWGVSPMLRYRDDAA